MNREPITAPRAIKRVYYLNDNYMTPEYLVTCLKPYTEIIFNLYGEKIVQSYLPLALASLKKSKEE